MRRAVLAYCSLVSAAVAADAWSFDDLRVQFPANNGMLVLVAANPPHVSFAIRLPSGGVWFTSPITASSSDLLFVHVLLRAPARRIERMPLLRFGRDDLLVLAKVADLAHSRIYELQLEPDGD